MEKEIKVYMINCIETEFNFRRAEGEADYESIMDEAERLGSVYSLRGFQNAINGNELFLDNSFILFYPLPEIDY